MSAYILKADRGLSGVHEPIAWASWTTLLYMSTLFRPISALFHPIDLSGLGLMIVVLSARRKPIYVVSFTVWLCS